MAGYDPRRSFGFIIADVTRLLRRSFNCRAQRMGLGLTPAQWQTLAHVSRNEGINQGALAQILEVQPITLSRLVDRLEAAGWVDRRPDPCDRRAVRLFLTDAAQPILERIRAVAVETMTEAMAGIPDDVREGIIDTLLAVRENLLCQDAVAGSEGLMTCQEEVPTDV